MEKVATKSSLAKEKRDKCQVHQASGAQTEKRRECASSKLAFGERLHQQLSDDEAAANKKGAIKVLR